MSTLITILLAVLVFGFLILIHELGHYLFARLFHVTITEFSIGMGPHLLTYESKKTNIKYSLSILPFGGYVAMVGEDEETDDPNALDKKPAWQRFIITAAGAVINIVTGFLLMILLTSMINVGNTTVAEFYDKNESGYNISSAESGLQVGDTVLRVNGKRVSILDELSYEIMRSGYQPVDLVVLRDGQEITLYDVAFPTATEQEQTFGMMDFKVRRVEKNFGTVLHFSWYKSCLMVRMCWESLFDLIVGRYTFAAVSGPVGITSAIGSAARSGFESLLYITILITINLGVMNLLPIPALDGGRLFLLLIEMITKKHLPRKVEGTINGIALVLLMLFIIGVSVKDVIGLFG